MINPARTAAVAAALALAACGSAGPLKWPEGGPPPPKTGTETAATPTEMLDPPPQAAPVRVDDPVRSGKPRSEDPFDLPPGG
ncbi:hypothetical protein KCG44_01920 [Pacificimonas sp. WHA3]|uniref:Argininosuccinate lyase n=1 Tax=Pacificimonas pallii TaxID=2827236 RepID=A0ABS6SAW1_9SPHN|nr:hypothetical protein [Pacificimonas pallii]MBV7255537.1 hypothetical protein [Pacificimonas pallii]